MELGYGTNSLLNTPLWDLIESKLNSNNLECKEALVNDIGDGSDFSFDNSLESNFRKSKIAWLSDEYLRKQIFHSVNLYNKQHWNYDLDGCDPIQYTEYNEGGKYDWHVDLEPETRKIGVENKSLMRKLSMTIWLNDPDEYEGGEFDIEVEGPRKDPRYDSLKLPKGSVVVFPSRMWHRVRPITSGERKSLVVWFRGVPFR